MGPLPQDLRKTLIWFQGTEMASHPDVTQDMGMKLYFCNPASPLRLGNNENTNVLQRQYFPKFTDLAQHRPQDLTQTESELNSSPRLILGNKPPVELFNQLLALQRHPQ
jgi:IS30 family transposase